MAMMIIDECIACGACLPECPNNAITEGEEIYVIDPDLCTECIGFADAPQCVDVCPVSCIVSDLSFQEAEEDLIKKREKIHNNI